ncbi:MAG: nucleotidyltransferase domain-containing protein [Candidatus Brocadia sp.]|nr:nucleotidyltransferase domain-containing protein [Candidatus Brocadia sp.]
MKEEIITRLNNVETKERVKILYACESGSRAWGFPSANSDYDVRFLYLHPKEWYLSIDLELKQDVIERPINDQIDLSGWDLRKALRLFRKSNPPLMEWLGSPIVYWDKYSTATQMRQLADTYYSPKACMYHYLHMARGNYREYLKGEQVWTKKYFYVLRPILASNWLEREWGIVPTDFRVMVNQLFNSGELKREIENLINAKMLGEELDYGPRIPVISNFIDKEIERLEGKQFADGTHPCSADQLNGLFRFALDEVWL